MQDALFLETYDHTQTMTGRAFASESEPLKLGENAPYHVEIWSATKNVTEILVVRLVSAKTSWKEIAFSHGVESVQLRYLDP